MNPTNGILPTAPKFNCCLGDSNEGEVDSVFKYYSIVVINYLYKYIHSKLKIFKAKPSPINNCNCRK